MQQPMNDFKVIQKVNIEELNRLASESGIECRNCLFLDTEKYCTFNDYIPRIHYCTAFTLKEQKEPAPLKTLNIEPYKLDK